VIEEAMFAVLKNAPALAALIGTRIYPQTLPQGSLLPAATYNVVDDREEYALDGGVSLHDCLADVVVWAVDPITARNVAKEVGKAFSNYLGIVGGIEIQSCTIATGSGLFEPVSAKYQRPVEVTIGYKEV
jgi:hypothetical protein